jgi:hypothetical protein
MQAREFKFTCETCKEGYNNRPQHERQHPQCKPTEQPPSTYTYTDLRYADLVMGDSLQQDVCWGLQTLRLEHGLTNPDIAQLKQSVTEWTSAHATNAFTNLKQYLRDDLTSADVACVEQALTPDFFNGIGTSKLERACATASMPYLEPRCVNVAKPRHDPALVCTFNVADLLIRHLQHDASFRQRCLERSDEWKRGDNYHVEPPDVMHDFDDGTVCRWHPHIMRKAGPGEENDLRVALLLNADDIETCSPIGSNQGKHKQCGVQMAVLNLRMEDRFRPRNILLAGMSRANVYKEHGMARVLCGVSSDGVQHNEPNIAADMRVLDEGIMVELPDDRFVSGGVRVVRLRAWIAGAAADMLGMNSMLPFMETPGAHCCCRGCNWNRAHPDAYRPFSFMRAPAEAPEPEVGAKRGRSILEPKWALRTWERLSGVLDKVRGQPELRKATFKTEGLNIDVFALDPKYFPGVDPCKVGVQDLLHMFPDGPSRHESAWMFNILCKKGLSLQAVNSAIARYRSWPPDCRIPPIQKSVLQCRRGGRPKRAAVTRMTGSQMMHFTIHSVALIEPLLSPTLLAQPIWAVWATHAELFTLAVQHSLTQA